MRSSILTIALFVLAAIALPAPLAAQASRTWVSGVGDDVNPCSRTAPCKTFAGAISKTAAGGEINCLDPAGYGAVTITKSITIDCEDTQGAILASSTTGVLVNGAGAIVVLRGITINGGPPALTGLHGVRFIQGASLRIEQVYISNFNSTSAGAGNGIIFAPGTAAELYVVDSTVANNGSATTGGGIVIRPTAGGSAKVDLRNVRVQNNQNFGVLFDTATTTAGGGLLGSLDNVEISGGTQGLVVSTPPATTAAQVMLANASVTNNTTNGISASGSAARVRVGNTTITGNGTGVIAAGGGIVFSYGDNRLDANTADGLFQAPAIPKK